MCTKKAVTHDFQYLTLLAGHVTFSKDCVTSQKSVCERGYQACQTFSSRPLQLRS